MATLAISRASEQLLSAIRVEYTRMPGMRLTRAQFRRLWQLDAGACDEALRRLMGDGFLIKESCRPCGSMNPSESVADYRDIVSTWPHWPNV